MGWTVERVVGFLRSKSVKVREAVFWDDSTYRNCSSCLTEKKRKDVGERSRSRTRREEKKSRKEKKKKTKKGPSTFQFPIDRQFIKWFAKLSRGYIWQVRATYDCHGIFKLAKIQYTFPFVRLLQFMRESLYFILPRLYISIS